MAYHGPDDTGPDAARHRPQGGNHPPVFERAMAQRKSKTPAKAKAKTAPKAARRSRRTPRDATAKKAAFLAAFAECGTVRHAAEAVGVDRSTAFRWLQNDPEFKAAFDDAEQQAADALEREARRRAIEGVNEPVIWQGQMTMVEDPETGEERPLTVKKYSDTLLIFLLKGAKPEKYRERAEVSGPGGGPIQTQAEVRAEVTPSEPPISDEERAKLLLDAARRAGLLGAGGDPAADSAAVPVVEAAADAAAGGVPDPGM